MLLKKRRHLKRYRQIISVFTRNGFGLLMEQLGIFSYLRMRRSRISRSDEKAAENTRQTMGERLRRSCEQLGPTFVKIGQILSTRPDIFSAEVTGELEKLQDSVNPFPMADVRTVIRAEFGEPLETVFESFDETPLAAASLSQVHRAVLRGGRPVVVKVQRPGIKESIKTDLEILQDLVHFIEHYTRYGELYDFSGMMAELEKSLNNELDFCKEGENADVFRRNFLDQDKVAVPEIRWVYTTGRVLTMEYISGWRITQTEEMKAAGINCSDLGIRLSHAMIRQFFQDGFFHADPHPGNLTVRPDGTIVFLDLGMVGRLSASYKRILSKLFVGIATQDSHQVVEAVAAMDTMKRRVSLRHFEQEIDRLLEQYMSLPMHDLHVGDLLAQIFQLAYVYHVRIPGELTLIAKTLITLQGVLDKLDQNLNLLEIMKPMVGKLLKETVSVDEMGRAVKHGLHDYGELLRLTPAFLLNLQHKLEDDDFNLQFDLKNIDKVQKHFDRITNRLSFSVILLAVSIIIAGIIVGTSLGAGVSPVLGQMNLVILRIGLGIAAVILLGLIISMFRSKHF